MGRRHLAHVPHHVARAPEEPPPRRLGSWGAGDTLVLDPVPERGLAGPRWTERSDSGQVSAFRKRTRPGHRPARLSSRSRPDRLHGRGGHVRLVCRAPPRRGTCAHESPNSSAGSRARPSSRQPCWGGVCVCRVSACGVCGCTWCGAVCSVLCVCAWYVVCDMGVALSGV